MDLQPLYTKILGFRPDLAAEGLRVMGLLQDAVRRVARETLLFKITTEIPYSADDWTVGPFGEGTLKTYELPTTGTGWADGVTLSVIRWMDFASRGAETDPPVVATSSSSTAFDLLIRKVALGAEMEPGAPEYFCDRMGVLQVAPAFDPAGTYDRFIVTAAVEPYGSFTEAPGLPSEATEAVLNFALADAFCLAGRNQSPGMGMQRLQMALNLCGKLRSMNMIGTSGGPTARMNPFDFQVGR